MNVVSGSYSLTNWYIHLYSFASGYPAIIMVKSTEHRESYNFILCILRARNHVALFRYPLCNSLMRSCLVEVAYIGIEHPMQLLLLNDQQVIEAFLSDTPHETFADRVGSWRMKRCFQNSNAAGRCDSSEVGTKLAIIIMNEVVRCLSIRVASRSCCAVHASVGERVTPT